MLCIGLFSPLQATTYYVAKDGDDRLPGTREQPFASINYALGQLRPGDSLLLRGGTYFESVVIHSSGTAKAPIIIASAPGERAVIDSGYPEFRQPGNNDWQLVSAERGEYRSLRACSDKTIYGYLLSESAPPGQRIKLVPYKEIRHFRASTDKYQTPDSALYVGPGTMAINGRCHIRLSKTAALRQAEQQNREFLREQAAPNDYAMVLSQAKRTVTIAGSYLTLRDITINQAKDSIELLANAHHVELDGITAWMGDSTIATYSGQVHNVTITRSKILGGAPPWIFWSDMKDPPYPADRARGTSIDLKGGTHNWVISHNLISGSGQDLISTNNGETRIFIHHNRLDTCGDDAIELEGKADNGGKADIGQIVIYNNLISNCLTAVSVGQDTEQMTGPLLFYRNVVSLLRPHPVNRQPGINRWNGNGQFGYGKMFKQAGRDYAARNVHLYQNTLLMLDSYRGIVPTPRWPDGSTFANNIVVMVNGEIIDSYNLGEKQLIGGNLYWKIKPHAKEPLLNGKNTVSELSNIEQHSIGDTPKQGTDPRFAGFTESWFFATSTGTWWPLNVDLNPWDVILSPDSPAKQRAIALSCRGVSGLDEHGKPFCSGSRLPDSYLSTDIGAIPSELTKCDFSYFPFKADCE